MNALSPAQTLAPANYGPLTVREAALDITPPIDLRRWLLPAALIGLTIDAFVSIWMAGGAAPRRPGALAALAFAALLGALLAPHSTSAAESLGVRDRDMDSALSARLAYVATGDATVDQSRCYEDGGVFGTPQPDFGWPPG